MHFTSKVKPNFQKFSGDEVEKTYLKYFAAGDLQTCWHGRKVRIAMGSTHPAQIRLVEQAYGKYTRPIIYPARKSDVYCWRIVCDLDKSFEFLFSKLDGLSKEELADDDLFFSALAGFADAEGHVGLQAKEWVARGRFQVYNTEKRILEQFQKELEMRHIHSTLHLRRREGWRDFWTLRILQRDVPLTIEKLSFRHEEKAVAKALVLKYDGQISTVAMPLYIAFRADVLNTRNEFIDEARKAYSQRNEKKLQKRARLRDRVLQTADLETKGFSIFQISQKMSRSQRTVYRWLRWHRIRDGFGVGRSKQN